MDNRPETKESKLGNVPAIYLETTISTTKMERMMVKVKGSRSDKIDKKNLKLTTVNLLYPTTKNTKNIFALLATKHDDDDKAIIINNQTHKQMENAYSTSVINV